VHVRYTLLLASVDFTCLRPVGAISALARSTVIWNKARWANPNSQKRRHLEKVGQRRDCVRQSNRSRMQNHHASPYRSRMTKSSTGLPWRISIGSLTASTAAALELLYSSCSVRRYCPSPRCGRLIKPSSQWCVGAYEALAASPYT